MKNRLLGSILIFCLFLNLLSTSEVGKATLADLGTIVPSGDVMVDENTFPDEIFRSWILDGNNLKGAGADGILTEEERNQITEIDVSDRNISSLKGIEVFSSLEKLNCARNNLTELDVSKNTELTKLYCGRNQLKTLSLEYNSKLTNLDCSFNRLVTLDLSNKKDLTILNCESNYLKELKLMGSTELMWMYCRNNLLSELDLSTNIKLKHIDAFDNQLASIDLRMLADLEFLNLDWNQLTILDISQNRNISPIEGAFAARNNFLEQLIVPDQPNLTIFLDAYEEQDPITGYDKVEWYLDQDFSQKVEGDLSATGQTLYAKRIPNNYRIYFSNNGGKGSMDGISVVYGEEIVLPQVNFTRLGYTFDRWNTLSNGYGNFYEDQQTVLNLAGKSNDERITLYAQWKPIEYKIAFDANHPSAKGNMDEITAVYDREVTLPAVEFEVDDLEFAGWAREKDGAVRYRDGANLWNLSAVSGETVTLYAVWRTPISEIQAPYLSQLEEAFQTYSSKDYTGEDWILLTDAYTAADQNIRNTDNPAYMKTYCQQGIQTMADILDRQDRTGEILAGWRTQHETILGVLDTVLLSENNVESLAEQAKAALADLTMDQLKRYSGLENPEDLERTAGAALEELQSTKDQLVVLIEASQWIETLDGLTTRPMNQVVSTDLEQYRSKLEEYQTLNQQYKVKIDPQVSLQLEQRRDLAEQKWSGLISLQAFYHDFDLNQYSEKGKTALAKALEEGIADIEKSTSADEIENALNQSKNTMSQVLTADQEPPAGGGGGSGSGGGGGSVPSYSIAVSATDNGQVMVNPTSAKKGSQVTILILPDDGYELEGLAVIDDRENRIALTDKGENEYTFTMPGRNVTVEASFRKTFWDNPFGDVGEEKWYYEAVRYVVKNGLFAGTGMDTFDPEGLMTRSMLVTVLYRAAGEPMLGSDAENLPFVDVDLDSWYATAVQWAYENGVVSGVDAEHFDPDGKITRQQLAVMLHRFAGSPESSGSLADFADGYQAEEYAREALCWTVENKVMIGKGDGILDPGGTATRAEVAQMVMNSKVFPQQ